MDTKDKIVTLCEGNPGALTVLMKLIELPELYDYLLENGPRGSDIWVLFKDVHNCEIIPFVDDLMLRMLLGQPSVA